MHGGDSTAAAGSQQVPQADEFDALGMLSAYDAHQGYQQHATGEWVTTDRDTDRAHSCETDLLTLSGSAEPPLETPHVQPVPSHDEPAVDPASRLQRPPNPPQQHLVIVSNRLPVNLTFDASTRKWSLPISSGGLVSALMGVGNHTTRWVGWPGECLPKGPERDAVEAELRSGEHACAPVWIPKDTLDLYYNGFCNAVLWQLFHYVPVQMDFRLAETHTLTQEWLAYQKANELFADAVAADYREGDVVWIQDYHLMLLPEMLKQRCPTMKVGFFLHTPFPSSEIYRTLPYREQLLRGVLKADLIGFHTYDYVRHFISSCTRILGLEGTPYGVEENGSLIRVAAFPIGIDPYKFEATLRDPAVADHIRYLKHKYSGLKVMLGVDRLDMIKGIPQKLLAFEKFLEDYEDCRSKVVLVQIAVPSRLDVPEYQQLRSQVHEIVGRINGRFGTLTHVPIHHLDRKLTFKELCALYAITDVALVTSLRDGMNLVSYEFVACQAENAGVLVLSEFAGAAQSLGAGSILVNPWNLDDMTAALHEAVRMSPAMRRRLWKSNYQHVSVHTAQTWGDHFIMELNETCTTQQQQDARHPPTLPLASVAAASSSARKRLIVLGYNAALKTVVSEKTPRLRYESLSATSGKAMVDEHILQMLHTLAQDSKNVVVIVSGATTAKLCSAFLPLLDQSSVWLAAENGAFMRPPRPLWDMFSVSEGSEWICLYENLNFSWVKSVEQVFEYFSARTPRSVVETRETSVVWNYKHADYEFGKSQAQDMLQHLLTGSISNSSVDVVRGARSVEVRMHGVNKGVSMSRVIDSMAWLLGHHAVAFDFVLCIGHFMPRDESIFSYFEGKDIVNADQGTTERPSGMTAPGATPAVLDHINPYAPAAPPGPPTPPSVRQVSQTSARPRMSTDNMGSRVWTMDSFDVDDQSATERGAGNSYDGEAPRVDVQSQNMQTTAVSPTSSIAPSPLEVPSSPVPGATHPTSPSQASTQHMRSATHPGNARPDFRGAEFHTLRRAQSPPPGGRHAPRGHSPSGSSPFVGSGSHFRHGATWATADQRPRRSTSSTLDLADAAHSDPQGERAGGSSSTPRGASGVQANVFPPTHLFTVTMGRSRSVARYCVDETKIVSRILECICNPHWSGAGTSSGHSTQEIGALGTPVTSVHLDGFSMSGLPTAPASLASLQPDGSERVLEMFENIPAVDADPAGSAAAGRTSPDAGFALHGSSSLSVSRTAQELSHTTLMTSADALTGRGADFDGPQPSNTAASQPVLAPITTAAPAVLDTGTPSAGAAGALGESVAARSSSHGNLAMDVTGPAPSGNLLHLPVHMNVAAGQSQQRRGRHSIADAGAGGGSIDGRNSALIMHNPAAGQEGRSTLFDAMGRPVPLAQAFSAAAAELPATERAWTRRSARVTTSARSVNCFEPTYEPENHDTAAGEFMPSIRSESDLSSLAPPPTLRVTSLDLPALRSVGYAHGASMPRMQALANHAEDRTSSGNSSMPSTTPSSHAHSARARTCSASGFMFGSLSAGNNAVRRQSLSTGLPWGTHTPLPEDSTLRSQLPPCGPVHDGSVFSRGCTSADDSNCTNTSSRPSGSALSAPVTCDVTGGTDDVTGSFEDGSTSEGCTLQDLMVSSHAIPDLRREASLPRAAPE